jgi:hypothetical protein
VKKLQQALPNCQIRRYRCDPFGVHRHFPPFPAPNAPPTLQSRPVAELLPTYYTTAT